MAISLLYHLASPLHKGSWPFPLHLWQFPLQSWSFPLQTACLSKTLASVPRLWSVMGHLDQTWSGLFVRLDYIQYKFNDKKQINTNRREFVFICKQAARMTQTSKICVTNRMSWRYRTQANILQKSMEPRSKGSECVRLCENLTSSFHTLSPCSRHFPFPHLQPWGLPGPFNLPFGMEPGTWIPFLI